MKNFTEYISGDEVTLVDFYATWCGPCKAMHSELTEYKKIVGNGVRVLKLDVDSPVNAAKVNEYQIDSVPTLMFFHKGEVVWRGSGVTSAASLKHISDSLVGMAGV
jgi:thioredoxin 1